VLRPGGRLLIWSPNRFSLGVDPHVRLWGLGFLPRRWAEAYVHLRRGGAWVPRTLSARRATRLAREAGFRQIHVGPPSVASDWASSCPQARRRLMLLYDRLSRSEPTRSLLAAVGPLWMLEARASSGAETKPSIRPVTAPGLAACLAAEVVAGGLGFFATIHLARRLGPEGFTALEVAAATAGWLLVLVRSGLDQVVGREASRRPRLIGRLTDELLGLRCVWAAVGIGLIAAVAGFQGSRVPLAAGLVLIPSALVADVGPRARNELGLLAGLQIVRAAGLLAFVLLLIADPADVIVAAVAPASAELIVAACCALRARRRGGWPRPRLQGRAAIALSKRAAIAGLTRFGRVGLYAADAIVLGLAIGVDRGGYAASRRVVFALVAVGVVVPTLLAPSITRAWHRGAGEASVEVRRGLALLLGLFVPAAVALWLASGLLLPFLFGADYGIAPSLLGLVAARLPILLTATWFQAALVATGREREALRVTIAAALVAAISLPVAAITAGPIGIGWAILAVEAIAASAGWFALRRMGINPGLFSPVGRRD
jgi:O-antigen/teichoic acid export membrane protein